MKLQEISNKAEELQKKNPAPTFYEMVLCFALENLFNSEDEELTEFNYQELLRIMERHCDYYYKFSPWIIADAIVACCRKYGVGEFIANYEYSYHMTWLDQKLEEMLD